MAVICEHRQKASYSSLNCPQLCGWSRALLCSLTVLHFSAQESHDFLGILVAGSTAALLNSLDLWWKSRTLLFSLFLSFSTVVRLKKLGLPSTSKKGSRANHRNRSRPQPQFQLDDVQSSPADVQQGFQDVNKKLGALTTSRATTNTKVDCLTECVAPQMANPAKQPSRRLSSAMENPSASAAEPDQVNIDDQVWLWVVHHMSASYSSFRAIINDESDVKEEAQPQLRRRTKLTSGKLRTMDTTAVKEVLWPHELVFTPDGQPAIYESLSSMAFVNGYFSTMALQKDTIRNKMTILLPPHDAVGMRMHPPAGGLQMNNSPVSPEQ